MIIRAFGGLTAAAALAGCAGAEPERAQAADPPGASALAVGGRTEWEPPLTIDGSTGATREEYLAAVQIYNLPDWALAKARREGHTRTLVPTLHLNPFYHGGDFNADGAADVALLVANRETGAVGVLLLHGGGAPGVLVGAGEPFAGQPAFDFRSSTNWHVRPAAGAGGADAVEMVKLESGAGLIRWNGRGYEWQQTDD